MGLSELARMNVAGESGVRRDFSDLAILRASVAAIMAAYLTLVVLNYMVYVLLFRGGTDLLVAIEAFPLFLTRAFDPMLMFMGGVILSCFAVLGLFVLAAQKNHTTFHGAFRAGLITGAIVAAVPLFFSLVSTFVAGGITSLPAAALGLLPGWLVTLATGGIAGLAWRFVAGPPSVMS